MMTNKYKVLFVCVHNSARSQMAQAFLQHLCADLFETESAGLEPGRLNPFVVAVMQEIGIDIRGNKTQSVSDLLLQGKVYHAVITVCEGASAERCPTFPGVHKRISWSFKDPSGFRGTEAEILQQTRTLRDEIKEQITKFIKEAKESEYWI